MADRALATPRVDLAEAMLLRALRRHEAWGEALPTALRGRWAALITRWRQGEPLEARARAHFCGPVQSPAFELLAWALEEWAPARGRRSLGEQVGEALLCEYFALRSEDDRVDEGADPADALLEHALRARAERLLGTASGDAEALARHREPLAVAFAEASLRDAALRRDDAAVWDDAAVRAQGEKFLPMVHALAAVALRHGRADHLDALEAGVRHLGVALQLTNDLFGARHDLATRQRTAWLARLDLAPSRDTQRDYLPAVRRAARRGHVATFTARIEAAMDAALQAFEPRRGARLKRHLRARRLALRTHVIALQMEAVVTAPAIVADIEVTRRCNLRCPACFVFAQEPPHERLPELSTELLLALLEELAGYETQLHLTGGEPFLHRGIWDVLGRAAELGMREVLINTNGAFVDDRVAARLAALGVPVRLMVSIDGPDDVQETARGAGMTARALDAIRAAWRHGVTATPATILTEELVASGVDRWFDRLAGELPGLQGMVLWPLTLRPDVSLPAGGGGSPLSAARHPQAAQQIAALHARGAQVVVADHPVINPSLRRAGVPEARLWQCNAGRGRLSVQADGSLGPCHPFRLPLGEVHRDGVRGFVRRVLEHPDYQRLGRRDHTGCRSCEEQSVCGSCQAAVVAAGHALSGHDGFCATIPGSTHSPPGVTPARRRLQVLA